MRAQVVRVLSLVGAELDSGSFLILLVHPFRPLTPCAESPRKPLTARSSELPQYNVRIKLPEDDGAAAGAAPATPAPIPGSPLPGPATDDEETGTPPALFVCFFVCVLRMLLRYPLLHCGRSLCLIPELQTTTTPARICWTALRSRSGRRRPWSALCARRRAKWAGDGRWTASPHASPAGAKSTGHRASD